MKRIVQISDITMKVPSDKTGFSLNFQEKIDLARHLDKMGMDVIETSPFSDEKRDSLLIKSIVTAVRKSVIAVPVDIDNEDSPRECFEALKGAARPRLQVCVPVSTVQMEYLSHRKPAAMLQTLKTMVGACAALCPDVEFVAGDFTRSDAGFLGSAVAAAVEAGARTVTLASVAGNLLPDEFAEKVAEVKEILPEGVRLGVSCSNDLFLADACAIAAVRAGADEIKTVPFGGFTVNLGRFVRILNSREDVLQAGCDLLSTDIQRFSVQIQRMCLDDRESKPVIEKGAQEPAPEISLTARDDRSTVMKAVSKLNYRLLPEDEDNVYEAFVRISAKNEVVGAKELDAIVASVAFQVPRTYKLESYVINSGNNITSTCHMRLVKGEDTLESVCLGDGPIAAAFLSIDKCVGRHYELDDFQIRSVTEGREAMGETVVRLREGGKIYSGRGISTDIVASGILAYLSAINKIAYEEAQ